MFGKVHFNNKKLVVYTGSFNLIVTKAQYLMLSEAINQIGLKSQFLLYTKEKVVVEK